MKKQLWKLVGGMAAVLLLAGCSDKAAKTPSAEPSQAVFQTEAGATTSAADSGKETADSSKEEENVLVLYTARSEQLNDAIIPGFEEETGIKVEIITGTTGECLKRVQSETANPGGDILWAADETMLASYQDLFMQYVSSEDDNMMDGFKNKSGYFTPAFADPTVMIINKNLIGDIKIEGFADLLNPELKGKIAFGDPTTLSSAYQSLVAMLYGMGKDGDPMSDEAWNFIDEFIANVDGKYANGGSQVPKSVAEGEYIVGLTWEDPVVNYIRNGAPVELIFPKEGAIFPGESVQIINGCKHPENAKKFVDYMLSEKAQSFVGQNLNARPLRKGVELGDHMIPTEDVTISSVYDEAWAAENKGRITEMFTEHREDSMQ